MKIKIRAIAPLPDGRIDCEIWHPGTSETLGWLPFTADPNDSEEVCRAVHAACCAGATECECGPPSREQVDAMTAEEKLAHYGLLDAVEEVIAKRMGG